MLTEILSGVILTILALIVVVVLLVVIVAVIGNLSFFLEPYAKALEEKEEQKAGLKTVALLSVLLLLCKYL